jgi:flagellar protein FliL
MGKSTNETEPAPAAPKKRRRLLLALLLLALAGGGGAAYYLLEFGRRPAAEAGAPPPPVTSYHAFEQAFTFNIAGSARLMQVRISVSTTSPPTLFETMAQHDAPLRAAILAALMEQNADDLTTADGKLALTRHLRDVINAELAARGGKGRIAEVFFTDLIIQ